MMLSRFCFTPFRKCQMQIEHRGAAQRRPERSRPADANAAPTDRAAGRGKSPAASALSRRPHIRTIPASRAIMQEAARAYASNRSVSSLDRMFAAIVGYAWRTPFALREPRSAARMLNSSRLEQIATISAQVATFRALAVAGLVSGLAFSAISAPSAWSVRTSRAMRGLRGPWRNPATGSRPDSTGSPGSRSRSFITGRQRSDSRCTCRRNGPRVCLRHSRRWPRRSRSRGSGGAITAERRNASASPALLAPVIFSTSVAAIGFARAATPDMLFQRRDYAGDGLRRECTRACTGVARPEGAPSEHQKRVCRSSLCRGDSSDSQCSRKDRGNDSRRQEPSESGRSQQPSGAPLSGWRIRLRSARFAASRSRGTCSARCAIPTSFTYSFFNIISSAT